MSMRPRPLTKIANVKSSCSKLFFTTVKAGA
jgi:hypothetical protein